VRRRALFVSDCTFGECCRLFLLPCHRNVQHLRSCCLGGVASRFSGAEFRDKGSFCTFGIAEAPLCFTCILRPFVATALPRRWQPCCARRRGGGTVRALSGAHDGDVVAQTAHRYVGWALIEAHQLFSMPTYLVHGSTSFGNTGPEFCEPHCSETHKCVRRACSYL
jgi:hypothetical protein